MAKRQKNGRCACGCHNFGHSGAGTEAIPAGSGVSGVYLRPGMSYATLLNCIRLYPAVLGPRMSATIETDARSAGLFLQPLGIPSDKESEKMNKSIGLCAVALVLMALGVAGTVFAAGAESEKRYLPVLCVGALMGAYDENGDWQRAPDAVTVDGKLVKLSEVGENKALMEKLKDGEEGVSCETPMIGAGTKLAFFGPDGRLGTGTVSGTSIWYMGEASGEATLDVAVKGFEADWSNLVVGVNEAVDAFMYAPTVRKTEVDKVVFVCERAPDDRYAVVWTPSGESYKGTVTVNGDAWPIPETDNVSPGNMEDVQCGFFYFGVGGGFELVVYDSGPNGFAAIYRITPGKGIQQLAWQYTGAE